MSPINRRQFLGTSATLLAGSAAATSPLFSVPYLSKFPARGSVIKGVQIGVQTYSYRSMPDQSVEAVLQYVVDSGISSVELWGDSVELFAGKPASHVNRRDYYGLMRADRNGELDDNQQKELASMREALNAYNKEVAQWRAGSSFDKFEEIRKMYDSAGVSIFAYKPRAFEKDNSDAEINWGMRATKALGANHITLEHPSDDAHTMKLGQMAKNHKMYIGYHGHEQQTPTLWDTALEQSKYNGLNLDLGHYVAAGNTQPLDIIRKKSDRMLSMHIKDRQTPENGKANLPWGEGDTPIAEALQLMRDSKYSFPATVEMEYEIPEGSDAVKEVRKCFEYCVKALG